jgi:hypothetical protein
MRGDTGGTIDGFSGAFDELMDVRYCRSVPGHLGGLGG